MCITVCVRLVAQPQMMIDSIKAICGINFTLCYSQLLIYKTYRMIRIGRYIYEQAPTGDWLKIGRIVQGIDSEHIQWYI